MNNKAILQELIHQMDDDVSVTHIISEIENQILTKKIRKLSAIISYELGSPLNSLKTISELLMMDVAKEDQNLALLTQTCKYVFSQVETLQRKMDNLIQWCHLETENYIFEPEDIDLQIFIKKITDNFSVLAYKKGIKIETYCAENFHVLAQPDMLSVILQNLVSNALKYSRKEDTITITARLEGKYITISVQDTGIGMGATKIKKLYNLDKPVQRGTANEQGLGLGLIVIEKMLAFHHQELHIKSERGKGSTFSFQLESVA